MAGPQRLPGALPLPPLPATPGPRGSLAPVQVLRNRCQKVLHEPIEWLERSLQCVNWEPSQAEARSIWRICGCEPAPTQSGQPHVRRELGADEAHDADVRHGRGRVASRSASTSASRPPRVPIIARSRTHNSSTRHPQGTRLQLGRGHRRGYEGYAGLSRRLRWSAGWKVNLMLHPLVQSSAANNRISAWRPVRSASALHAVKFRVSSRRRRRPAY